MCILPSHVIYILPTSMGRQFVRGNEASERRCPFVIALLIGPHLSLSLSLSLCLCLSLLVKAHNYINKCV